MIAPPARPLADGPAPKHIQLSVALARLAADALSPGEMIPSERSLMAEFGVSRATVRRAVDSLIADGLLQRVPGKGTYVREPRIESQLHLASFTRDMRRRGRRPTTALLDCREVRPSAEVREALQLRPGATVWAVSRVRLADGQPIALEEGHYPQELFPGLNRRDLTGSLYEIFAADYGVVIDSAEQTLWGETPDEGVARHLEGTTTTPLLVFQRTSRSAGRPVEHVISRYRGDRYRVHMTLGEEAQPEKGPPS